jgi:branched-chain amino acid transport system permease protein
MDFSGIPQFVAGGLTVGAVYGLVGAGFSLIFKASKVINFAQGEFVVLGGLVTYSFVGLFTGATLTATLAAALMALAVVLALGALLYTLLRTAKRGGNEFTYVMVTLAVAIALRGAAGLVWGTEYKTFPLYPRGSIKVLGAVVTYGTLITVAATLLVSLGLWLVLYRTMVGKAMRACADDPMAAQTVGIRPQRMVLYAYLGSAFMGGLAGILLTPMLMMSYDNGVMLALKGFTAAVAGGLANPFGAIVGGLVIGIIESLGVGMISSELQNAYAFVALLLVLFLRPQGLFGGRAELTR